MTNPSGPMNNNDSQIPQYFVQPKPSNGTALLALILGIFSIFCLGVITGIPAIFVGISGKKKAASMNGEGYGQAKAGIITGIIGSVLSVIICVFVVMQISSTLDTASDSFKVVKTEIKKAVDESQARDARNEKIANGNDYKITDEKTLVRPIGKVSFEGIFQNDANFESAYSVEIQCESAEGKIFTETGKVPLLKHNNSTSFKIELDFGSAVSNVECKIVNVRYIKSYY